MHYVLCAPGHLKQQPIHISYDDVQFQSNSHLHNMESFKLIFSIPPWLSLFQFAFILSLHLPLALIRLYPPNQIYPRHLEQLQLLLPLSNFVFNCFEIGSSYQRCFSTKFITCISRAARKGIWCSRIVRGGQELAQRSMSGICRLWWLQWRGRRRWRRWRLWRLKVESAVFADGFA